jgi:hypothetical protein
MLDLDNLPPRLRRADVPEYLYRKYGIRVAPTTLASWAVHGGGPRFQKDGRWPLYPVSELDGWAERRFSPLVRQLGGSDEGKPNDPANRPA